jgi:hypothetical protein
MRYRSDSVVLLNLIDYIPDVGSVFWNSCRSYERKISLVPEASFEKFYLVHLFSGDFAYPADILRESVDIACKVIDIEIEYIYSFVFEEGEETILMYHYAIALQYFDLLVYLASSPISCAF